MSATGEGKKGIKRKKEKIKKLKTEPKTRDEVLVQKKALTYLKQWHRDRGNWKFEKLKQIWLIQNMLDASKIPDKKFKIFLQYIVPIKGSARRLVEEKASEIISAMEKRIELEEQGLTENEILAQNPQLAGVTHTSYERSRQILQSLQEE
ncbi:uncharacterized protein C7orf50 [Schistocerca americana]|uniref:uncharacterized protein C7orf50 n=1 Tax=Schistocerca americana TaxID=7009 RepID=UPI001F4F79BB|nr:uncharacterized protein C7orf50 [Schistocerca americana]XP_049958730.1 uncharacterized protein C7orf50 [Schistocerca serialis cubense]